MTSFVSFNVPTTNIDGTPITETLSYNVLIDTVSPPLKSYPVPAAQIAAAVAGVVTVTFVELGFTPVNKIPYFVTAVAADSDGTSGDANIATFINTPLPNAPTRLTVG